MGYWDTMRRPLVKHTQNDLVRNREEAGQEIGYLRSSIDEAFEYGEPVVIRTKVREQDSDGIRCPRCWDEVRHASNDPSCPACYGSGWVHNETFTGYRLRVFTRAHIRPLDDQLDQGPQGLSREDRVEFWINYTARELRDDDLIARIEPDDVMNPTFVREKLDLFEVVSALQPSLMPQYHPQNNPYILAQKVITQVVGKSRPEYMIDMNENLKTWQLFSDNPLEYLFSDAYLYLEDQIG